VVVKDVATGGHPRSRNGIPAKVIELVSRKTSNKYIVERRNNKIWRSLKKDLSFIISWVRKFKKTLQVIKELLRHGLELL
jgi:hypothetical protein